MRAGLVGKVWGWLLIIMLTASVAFAGDIKVSQERPRIWLTPERLAVLRQLLEVQAPTWNRLIAWAEEQKRAEARPQDGPGLALASQMLKGWRQVQARRLGRMAVACTMASVRYGKVESAGERVVVENKRRGSQASLKKMGYRLLALESAPGKTYKIDRISATRVYTASRGPALAPGVRAGNLYFLLWDDLSKAASRVADAALAFDWAYDFFTEEERKGVAAWLVAQAKALEDRGRGCFDSASAAALHMTTLAALAAWDQHKDAAALLRQALSERYEQEIKPCLTQAGKGGAWFEGDNLGALAGLHLLEFAAAVRTATGLDPADGVPWFGDRLEYILFHVLPHVVKGPSGGYRPLPPGDGDRVLSDMKASDLTRLQVLILLAVYPQNRGAGWARALLDDKRTPRVQEDFLVAKELIWLVSKAPVRPLATAPLLHLAPDTGRAVSRSDWSDLATWLGLSAGPHYSGAQHLAAGSLQLFQQGLLLGPGGVYDGYTTPQALNFAIRSVAHNTVLIHDPSEYSWYDMRSGPKPKGSYSNDGGQRAWSSFDAKGRPETIAPWTASGWETGPAPWRELRQVYDVARIEASHDMPRFAYLRARLTGAYQGSTKKAARAVRHVFHLRPGGPQDAGAAEVIMVVDDLKLTRKNLRTSLVMHLGEEPKTNAKLTTLGPGRKTGPSGSFRVEMPDSRLDVITLQPPKSRMEIYGGLSEASFWAAGKNYPPKPPRMGEAPWRVEIGPAKNQGLSRVMLHCLLPAPSGAAPPPAISNLKSFRPGTVGIVVADPLIPRVVALRLGEPDEAASLEYSFPAGRTRHLAAGLVPGKEYRVDVQPGKVSISPGTGLKASSAGVLSFQAAPAGQAPPKGPNSSGSGQK